MDAFVSRKRRRTSPDDASRTNVAEIPGETENESTEFKLAILASLHPDVDQGLLLEALLAHEGSVEQASRFLEEPPSAPSLKKRTIGYQSSLASFATSSITNGSEIRPAPRLLPKKGKTLYLYSPEDIENNTPCSIIHNFLPAGQADALLRELLQEAPTFQKDKFQLFDRVVESPHTMCFYVDSWDEAERQKNDYVYNGSRIKDIRQTLPEMRKAALLVQEAVNAEITRRITHFYPQGQKLKHQSPAPWVPNASFVNCYAGGGESVGWHADQLTYLGPRAVIGSLSLGVAREFRVRRIVRRAEPNPKPFKDDLATSTAPSKKTSKLTAAKAAEAEAREQTAPDPADAGAQISLPLPHNSLLIMHAEMQEEWKHSIAPSATIDPHPVAGNKRINITYRSYRPSLAPDRTPRCWCGVGCVLRFVRRGGGGGMVDGGKEGKGGGYVWTCDGGRRPEGKGCTFFQWAEFDDDGEPVWAKKDLES